MTKQHGHTYADGQKRATRTYAAWSEMRARCRNPNHHQWKNYGARGIKVCCAWESFERFLADMGEAPVGKSLDRRDNSSGYSKDNCRWATKQEQGRNRRTNVCLSYGGETLCMAEWTARLGYSENTIRERLSRGWTVEQTLGTPV